MKRVQFIRHNTAQANAFLGREGEISIDLTAKEIRAHDNITLGGIAMARKDLANVLSATTSNDGKMTASHASQLATVISGLAQELLDRAQADSDLYALIVANANTIASEIASRILDVDTEETRALAAEAGLQNSIDAEAIARANADANLIPLAQKGAANGVATLNASSQVVQSPAEKGSANGLASLNASGRVVETAETALTANACSGNSATATNFNSNRTITINGVCSGSSNSSDGAHTITLLFAANSVTMSVLNTVAGTDTYTIVGGTSLAVASEGWYAAAQDGAGNIEYQAFLNGAWRTVETIPNGVANPKVYLVVSGSTRLYNAGSSRGMWYRRLMG